MKVICVSMMLLVAFGLWSPVGLAEAVEGESRPTQGPYNHFLFVRHDKKDGTAATNTLVMAKVTPDAFELRDVSEQQDLTVFFHPLCVVGGKLYALKMNDVISVDLQTGGCQQIGRILYEYGVSSPAYCFDSGRLYCFGRLRQAVWLRVCDFPKGGHRDVVEIPEFRDPYPFAVSPDHNKAAWFEEMRSQGRPPKHVLTVVDIEAGTIQRPCQPVEYFRLAGGHFDITSPELAWIDAETVLFPRTQIPPEDIRGGGVVMSRATEVLSSANVNTGQIKDVALVPRNAAIFRLISRPHDKKPIVHLSGHLGHLGPGPAAPVGRYCVDLKTGRLIEDDNVGGTFRAPKGREARTLYDGNRRLGSSPPGRLFSVSPDGTRAVWAEGKDRWNVELKYYDQAEEAVRTICKGRILSADRMANVIWFSDQELAPARPEPKLPPGWVAFSGAPWPEARPPEARPKDTRPHINEFLKLSLSTDKERYRLHEPVYLTLTVSNVGETDFEIFQPRIDHSVDLSLRGPRRWKVVDGFYGDSVERVLLKAGESISTKEVLEVRDEGAHRLEGELMRGAFKSARPDPIKYRGSVVEAPPVSFSVEPTGDASALLEEKVQRLIRKARAQQAKVPAGEYRVPALDDMREVGPELARHLMPALREETDELMQRGLRSVLVKVASPDALPLFLEWRARGDEAEQKTAVEGLYALYRRNTPAKDAAFGALIEALKDPHASQRGFTANVLKRIYDPRVKAAFEEVVGEKDESLSRTAARYLAAYEGLDLAEWLALAAEQPTHARYLVACSFIRELEKTWRTTMGDLPDAPWEEAVRDPGTLEKFREVVRAWATWARDNPRFSSRVFYMDRRDWPKSVRASRRPSRPATTEPVGEPAQPTQPEGRTDQPAWGEAVEGV